MKQWDLIINIKIKYKSALYALDKKILNVLEYFNSNNGTAFIIAFCWELKKWVKIKYNFN